MKYLILICGTFLAFYASADTVSGRITKVIDNVAYLQSTNGKRIPVILTNNTYYRKKKVMKKGRRTIDSQEVYQPMIIKGDNVTLTYDTETADKTTGAVKASDVLIIINE